MDEAKLRELWSFILTKVHEDAYFIPMSYAKVSIATTADMKDLEFLQTQYEIPFQHYSFG